jgi:UDP-glucose:(heptosyl)LPS alpha-1,3-glucosyltransferase
MVKADILRHFDIDPAKLRVILSGVDTTVFHPGLRELHRAETRKTLRIPKSAPVALFVGSGFERKGLIGFLMGLADQSGHSRLTRESVRGIVVGHDKHMTRFQSFADQLGLSDRVSFVGGVNDVRPFYAAADIFVLPTLYDPLPNACLEAMACGLPVITSTGSGAAELITNGVEGFVVDALDTPAIADAIEASLASAMSDHQMGKNAAAKVAPLTPRAMAANYVALYRELLGTNVATGVDNSGPVAHGGT